MIRLRRFRYWLASLIAPREAAVPPPFVVKADWLYFRSRGTGYEVGCDIEIVTFGGKKPLIRPIQMTECEFGRLCAAGHDLIDRVRKVQEGGRR